MWIFGSSKKKDDNEKKMWNNDIIVDPCTLLTRSIVLKCIREGNVPKLKKVEKKETKIELTPVSYKKGTTTISEVKVHKPSKRRRKKKRRHSD